MRKSWNGRLYGAIIWCDPLAVFVERGKLVKCLPQHILGIFFFFFFTVFTACTWNLCRTFPETSSEKQIPKVVHLENTLKIITVTILEALLRNLAALFSGWHCLLMYWKFKTSNFAHSRKLISTSYSQSLSLKHDH